MLSQTRAALVRAPGSPVLNPNLLAAIRHDPSKPPLAVAYAGIGRHWTMEDVEAFEEALHADPKVHLRKERSSTQGRSYVTRRERCKTRESFPYRYVRRYGVAPVLDVNINAGQARTLAYLICRTGKGKSVSMRTSWIARDLGYHVRTIQLHLQALLQAGYIRLTTPHPMTKEVLITLRELCEVQPRSAFKKAKQITDLRGVTAKKNSDTHETSSFKREPPPKTAQDVITDVVKGANSSREGGAALEGSTPPSHSRPAGSPVSASPPNPAKPAPDPSQRGFSAEPKRILQPVTAFDKRLEAILSRHGLSPASQTEEHTPSSPGTQPEPGSSGSSSGDP
jgi:DNA-binding MarR family transcriptional regulator